MPNQYRQDGPLDAEAGAFFQDELRTIDERILEDVRAPLNGFRVIPQNNTTAGAFDNQYEERSMQFTGIAEFIGDAADDMPFVDVALRVDVWNIRSFGCAFMHGVLEIEKAREIGRPLEEWRARAAKVANEEKHNRIMWYGDPAAQLFGVLNNPFVNRFFFANDIIQGTAALTILADVNAMLTVPFDVSETTAEVDFLGLPPQQYRLIMTRFLGSGDAGPTIAEAIVKGNPRLTMERIVPLRELRGAGPNGEDMVVAWEMNEDTLKHNVSILFRRFPPQPRMLQMVIPTLARSGGVSMRQPRKAVLGILPLA